MGVGGLFSAAGFSLEATLSFPDFFDFAYGKIVFVNIRTEQTMLVARIYFFKEQMT